MARQKGIIKIEGTLGELSFYDSVFGPIVRQKGGADKQKIRNDPAFENLRKHQREFGSCARAGRLLRESLAPLLGKEKDHGRVGRINKLLFEILKCDLKSPYGERSCGKGLATAEGQQLLRHFQLNSRQGVDRFLKKKVVIDKLNDRLLIPLLDTSLDLRAPAAAGELRFRGLKIGFDPDAGVFQTELSNEQVFTIGSKGALTLTFGGGPFQGQQIYAMVLDFRQKVNGNQVKLAESVAEIVG